MKLRRFVGPTMAAALRDVKGALGADAVILETRSLPGRDRQVEVTAAVDEDPAPAVAPTSADAVLAAEVRELSRLVRTLVARERAARSVDLEPQLVELHASLVGAGVDGVIAASFIEETAAHLSGGAALTNAVAAAVSGALRFEMRGGGRQGESAARTQPRVRVFFGLTGDGKTTTIAKLAGMRTARGKRRVALVSADTYRIGGADELASYARILDMPLAVAAGPRELRDAVKRFGDTDEILVDTGGITIRNGPEREELQSLVDAVRGACRTVVVSATTAPAVTRRVWSTVSGLQPDACVVTKVDEAPAVGALEVLWRRDVPLAFFGTGRRVPHDLEEASPERMATWLVAA
jgi:flagellar biosynthesis protein FlhF